MQPLPTSRSASGRELLDPDALAEYQAEREARRRPLVRLGSALGAALPENEARADRRIQERIAANEAARAAGLRHLGRSERGDLVWFGPLTDAERAEEEFRTAQRLTRRVLESGIPPLYAGADFARNSRGESLVRIEAGAVWEGVRYVHGTGRAIDLCRRLADEFYPGWVSAKGFNGIVLRSFEFGCGKTSLVCAVLVAMSRRGLKCRFVSTEELLQRYRRSFGQAARDAGELTAQQIFDDLANCDVLALDELGGEYVKQAHEGESGGWARSQFLRLIEHRYQRNLPTLATTNLSKEALGRFYEGRMASRLLSRSVYVAMDGPDFRQPEGDDMSDPFAEDGLGEDGLGGASA